MKNRMKKIAVLLGICSCVALTACGSKPAEETKAPETVTQIQIEEETKTEETPEVVEETEPRPIASYLTGIACTEEEMNQRPLAVMINNIKAGTPQAGISQASVIYEAPMEKADATRLMPLFEHWTDLERIGYIRSSRDYFVYAALEFDAIYMHFGQATPYVGAMLNSDAVDNISGAVAGIDRPATKAFYRDEARKAPHNVYTSGKDVLDAVKKFNYPMTYHDTHKEKFTFAPEGETPDHSDAPKASVMYPGGKSKGVANGYSNVQTCFKYNEEDGKYYRFQYGAEHIDELNGEQLAFDNVIFQYCHGEFRDSEGYMSFVCHGGWQPGDVESGNYKCQVFTGGRMIEGTWSRYYDTDPAYYLDEKGEPIELKTGKTMICIIWLEKADDVVIEE